MILENVSLVHQAGGCPVRGAQGDFGKPHPYCRTRAVLSVSAQQHEARTQGADLRRRNRCMRVIRAVMSLAGCPDKTDIGKDRQWCMRVLHAPPKNPHVLRVISTVNKAVLFIVMIDPWKSEVICRCIPLIDPFEGSGQSGTLQVVRTRPPRNGCEIQAVVRTTLWLPFTCMSAVLMHLANSDSK